MKLKFMFINAVDPNRGFEIGWPPLGLGYLASSIRKQFGSDLVEFKTVSRDIAREVNSFKPDIVGITSVSQNYNRAIKHAQTCKKYDLPVIIGGPHISALPSTLTSDMDVGVIEEGEETIIDLLSLFLKRGCFDKGELHNVDGIVFRRDNELVITKKRQLIQPLDKIPMPARDILSTGKRAYMVTSRGCPYRCIFCHTSAFWERTRYFSAKYVVSEIKQLVEEYGVKTIGFEDSLFIADKERLRQIVELLEEEAILGRVRFSYCSARANLVNDEIAQLLKRMQMNGISLGLESASPHILQYLKGKSITVQDNMNAIKTAKKYGIESGATFIIGSPQETREDILQTLRFIKEAPLASSKVSFLTPLPGTTLWEYAKTRNLVSDHMDWDILDINPAQNKNAIILSERLTREELMSYLPLFRKAVIMKALKHALENPVRIPGILLEASKRLLRGELLGW